MVDRADQGGQQHDGDTIRYYCYIIYVACLYDVLCLCSVKTRRRYYTIQKKQKGISRIVRQ
jgi:hypothetical protein